MAAEFYVETTGRVFGGARRLTIEHRFLKLEVYLEVSLGVSYLGFFFGGEESNVCFPQSLSSSANTVEGIINVLAEFCKIRRNQAQEVLGEEVCHQQPTCWTYKG